MASANKPTRDLLLGIWRSDRERTEAQWVWPKKIAVQRRREFFKMFGQLTLKFTRKRCYETYEGKATAAPYRILWEGQPEIFQQLIVVYGNGANERAQHIFFDTEDSFYTQGGKCAEFFRRES